MSIGSALQLVTVAAFLVSGSAADQSPPMEVHETQTPAGTSIAEMRLARIALIDREHQAIGSDDDLEAKALHLQIEELDRRILAAEALATHESAPAEPNPLAMPQGLQDGLVLYCPFDGGSVDFAGNAGGLPIRGIARGARWSEAGRSGGACSLDGIDDVVEFPIPDTLTSGGDLTLSLCVRPLEPLQTEQSPCGYLFSKSTAAGADFWLQLSPALTVGGGIRTVANPPAYTRIASVPGRLALPRRAWSHVVVAIKAGVAAVHVNGRLDKSVTLGSNPTITGAPLQVGRCGFDGWAYGFSGQIDDVAIWRRALSEVEILGLWVWLKRSATDPQQLGPLVEVPIR
jgi:hypothetical protein